MDLRNCPECGRVFTYIRTNMCPSCQQKEEEEFKTVRSYLSKHPGVDVLTVSEETGIDENKIIKFIRNGRLSSGLNTERLKIECEVCGALISSGRYCQKCIEKLTSGLKKTIQEENKKIADDYRQKGRMYTAEHWKDKNN